MLRAWNDIPMWIRKAEVKEYYDILAAHKLDLLLKRFFDVVIAAILLAALTPLMLIISALIALDSPGGVFFRQVRVTAYGHKFRIHKFRTMVADAESIGSKVAVGRDIRITQVGHFLRKYRLDEIPQLIDVLSGNMSFVGTRPEIPQYVRKYTPEMRATLLLPAGITSEASIQYRNEAELLEGVKDVDNVYVKKILPEKMKYNLDAIRQFCLWNEIQTMFRTVFIVFGKRLGK